MELNRLHREGVIGFHAETFRIIRGIQWCMREDKDAKIEDYFPEMVWMNEPDVDMNAPPMSADELEEAKKKAMELWHSQASA